MPKPNKEVKNDDHASLVKAAEAKWEHDKLVKAAEAKWVKDHSSNSDHNDALETIETGMRGAAEGVTVGLSEPIVSSMNAFIGNLIDAGYDSDGIKDFVSKVLDKDRIEDSYGRDVDRRRDLKKEHPYAQMGGEVAGAIGSPANKVFGAVGKLAGTAATKAIPGAEALLASKGIMLAPARGTAKALKAGVEGAGMVASAEGTKRFIEGSDEAGFIQPQDQTPSMMELAGTGAKFGAGANATIGAIKGGASLIGKVAKPIAKGVLAGLGGVKPEVIQEYIEKGSATRDAHSPEDAKAILDEAIYKIQEATTGKRSKFIDDVLASVERLKEKVNKGSDDAYKILDKHKDKTVKVPNMKRVITLEKKTLQPVEGVEPVGGAASAASAKLDKYRAVFDKFPKEISLRQAKMILQQLGHDMTEVEVAGGYGSPSHNAIASVRSSLDKAVKKLVPEYQQQMLTVADDTKALIQMSKKFGTPERVMSKIDRFETQGGALEKEALADLEARTMGQGNLLNNNGRLSQQLETIHEAKPVMRIGKSQNFMQSIFNRSSIENKKTLELISQLDGRDLVSLLENAGTKDAFTKQFNAGSANVNVWTVLTATAMGTASGAAVGGMAGGAAGAIIGAMVKFYGPSTTKIVLDGISRIQGAPTLRKIEKALQGVPEDLQNRIKEDLIRAVQTGAGESVPVLIPPQDYQQTLLDIDGAKNLNTIEKAKAIDSLNRTKEVNSQYMQKIMLDGGEDIPESKQLHFDKSGESDEPNVRIEDVTQQIRNMKK
jgi:hypothetical protein